MNRFWTRMKLDDDFVHFLSELRKKLCEEYQNRVRHFQPLCWIEKMQFNLENVYTELSIVKRSSRRRWEKTRKIVQLSDIFDEDEKSKPRIILIEGSPGMGKTTLSLKLAHDWAKDQMPDKFPEVELVLLIKCRDMKDSIQESAKTQLLPFDDKHLLKDLDSFFHFVPDKIMLIVDGVDEISEKYESHVFDLLKRRCLRDCYVVLTSRQEKGMEVRKYCDKLLEINGYSHESRNNYINKYFESNLDLAEKLQEKIQRNTEIDLQTLAMNPLNTLLLCVVFEDNDGNLPTTVTELYDNIVECIWKRYCKKEGLDEKDNSFKMAMHAALGRLAYESLIEHDTLYFRESKLKEDEIQCTNIGFLYKDNISTKILMPDNTYWFLHKTFQEFFAAYHCVYTETEIDMSKLSHYTSKGGAKFIQVLKFMSSMLQKQNVEDHKEFIKQLGLCFSCHPVTNEDLQAFLSIFCTVLSENDLDRDIAGTVKTFIPKKLEFKIESRDPYNEYFLKIMPRILNLLETGVKGEDDQKVELLQLEFSDLTNGTEWLKLICEAQMKNLVVNVMYFEHCSLEVNYLAEMLSENSTVRTLILTNNGITNEGLDILAKGLCTNSTLEALILSEYYLGFKNESPSKFTGMAEMLARNDKLEELCLNNNPLGSAGVTWIAEALESNKGVKRLYLNITDCGDEGAAALAKMLSANSNIRELSLEKNGITNEGLDILANGLCKNTTLETLTLSGNDLGFKNESSSKFTGMAEMLATNDKLKELKLDHNPLGSTGVTWIAEALESNKGVKHLYLQNTDCGDEGAAALAKMLGINKTLEFLYLCGRFTLFTHNVSLLKNNIGDEGATALADVLKEHNSSLKELHLCRNKNITDKGLKNLTETVQKNKALTLYIDCPEQKMKDDEETMVRIKPGCRFKIF